MAIDPQKSEKPKLPPFPEAQMNNADLPDTKKVDILINYIDEVGKYLTDVKVYITTIKPEEEEAEAAAVPAAAPAAPAPGANKEQEVAASAEGEAGMEEEMKAGGKKKQRKTKKKGGADIDYSKVYNVQGLIENISKSTGKDPIASQSVPAPFSTGSPLQRFGKKEAKSLPNELKNEIIPDYSQDGGKKKKTEKKKMPKKK